MAQPKVAMIGDGNVGTALSKGLTRAGYEVQSVGKVPEKVREIARWGDIIVLAVPFNERANALKEMGDALAGKPLVDVTNAFGREETVTKKSGAEELQEMAVGGSRSSFIVRPEVAPAWRNGWSRRTSPLTRSFPSRASRRTRPLPSSPCIGLSWKRTSTRGICGESRWTAGRQFK